MYIKIHKNGRKVVAVCDEELIGKKFEEGKKELNVSERFYKGKNMEEKEVVELIKDANIVNIVGKKAIKLAIKNNLISKENIIKIKGIPHAQIIKL